MNKFMSKWMLLLIICLNLSLGFFLGDRLYSIIYGTNEFEEVVLLSYSNSQKDESNHMGKKELYEKFIEEKNIDDTYGYTKEAILGLGEKNFKENYVEEEKKYKKICYLTFDDGPTKGITDEILKVLNNFNIEATFFILGNLGERNEEIVVQAFEEGHYIANHSYSHKYNNIYSNRENFISEVEKSNSIIEEITGVKNNIFRFPGGSFGRSNYIEIIKELGYVYVDWNALNGDAEGVGLSEEYLIRRIKETMHGQDPLIILMHDSPGKESTVAALPEIIEYIESEGYEFRTLEGYGVENRQ